MSEEHKEKIGQGELIIQQKIYDMIMYAYPAIEQFPKSQKFSLAADMKKCLDAIMRLTITANKKYTKKTTLQELDVEIEAVKIYIRMAFELGYLPPKKYEIWSKMAVEVGKMIGGWIKAARLNQVYFEKEEAEAGCKCVECGTVITKIVNEYSTKHFNKALCRKCQERYK